MNKVYKRIFIMVIIMLFSTISCIKVHAAEANVALNGASEVKSKQYLLKCQMILK